jgi:hypothetical protein
VISSHQKSSQNVVEKNAWCLTRGDLSSTQLAPRHGMIGMGGVPEQAEVAIAIFPVDSENIPSGKHTKNYGKSLFLMGKSTIHGHFQ